MTSTLKYRKRYFSFHIFIYQKRKIKIKFTNQRKEIRRFLEKFFWAAESLSKVVSLQYKQKSCSLLKKLFRLFFSGGRGIGEGCEGFFFVKIFFLIFFRKKIPSHPICPKIFSHNLYPNLKMHFSVWFFCKFLANTSIWNFEFTGVFSFGQFKSWSTC